MEPLVYTQQTMACSNLKCGVFPTALFQKHILARSRAWMGRLHWARGPLAVAAALSGSGGLAAATLHSTPSACYLVNVLTYGLLAT